MPPARHEKGAAVRSDDIVCPQGLPSALWEKFLEHRDARLQIELHLRKEQESLGKMKKQLCCLDEKERRVEESIDQGVAEVRI